MDEALRDTVFGGAYAADPVPEEVWDIRLHGSGGSECSKTTGGQRFGRTGTGSSPGTGRVMSALVIGTAVERGRPQRIARGWGDGRSHFGGRRVFSGRHYLHTHWSPYELIMGARLVMGKYGMGQEYAQGRKGYARREAKRLPAR